MIVSDILNNVEEARNRIRAGDMEAAERYLSHVVQQLDRGRMLTTSEAAALLGIKSKNTIKAMVRRGDINAVKVGERYLIPMTEIIRLQHLPIARELRAIERDYDAMAFTGSDEPLSAEEMASLRENQPGTLPWQR